MARGFTGSCARVPFLDHSVNYETNPDEANQPRGETLNEGRNGDDRNERGGMAQEWISEMAVFTPKTVREGHLYGSRVQVTAAQNNRI
jgi:hypothetical protein